MRRQRVPLLHKRPVLHRAEIPRHHAGGAAAHPMVVSRHRRRHLHVLQVGDCLVGHMQRRVAIHRQRAGAGDRLGQPLRVLSVGCGRITAARTLGVRLTVAKNLKQRA